MEIDVEIFGQLLPGSKRRQTLSVEQPLCVREVAARLGLEPNEIGLITINSVQSELDDLIPPNSRLCFFPFMSGG